MTQLNENTKLGDLKVFFPRSCFILRQYGIEHLQVDEVSLRSLCDLYEIDLHQLLTEISKHDDEHSANITVPNRILH